MNHIHTHYLFTRMLSVFDQYFNYCFSTFSNGRHRILLYRGSYLIFMGKSCWLLCFMKHWMDPDDGLGLLTVFLYYHEWRRTWIRILVTCHVVEIFVVELFVLGLEYKIYFIRTVSLALCCCLLILSCWEQIDLWILRFLGSAA